MSDGSTPSRAEQLRDAIAVRGRALDALLVKYERAVACSELDLADAGLVEHLREQRRVIAVDVADAMLHWQRLGGTIAFAPADESEPVVAPAPVPETIAEVAPVEESHVLAFPRLVEPLPPEVPADVAPAAPVAEPVVAPSIVDMFARATLMRPLDLSGLRRHLEGGGPVRPEPNENWVPKLAALLRRVQLTANADVALERLEASIRASDDWVAYPAHVQRQLLGLHGAWLRALQHDGAADRDVTFLFSTLTAYSKREQPGVVHGLARFHEPLGASWADDAEVYREELDALVEEVDLDPPSTERLLESVAFAATEVDRAPSPVHADAVRTQVVRALREALASGVRARDVRLTRLATPHIALLGAPEFKALRKSIRSAAEADAEEPEDADGSPLPVDWAFWSKTRGRRAVMVGGSPREINRGRLERAFGFAELDWMPAEFRRNSLLAVRQRVVSGSVDLVLILRRFVGHDADDIIIPACKERGLDWVHVEHGYGAARVRQAIERFLRDG